MFTTIRLKLIGRHLHCEEDDSKRLRAAQALGKLKNRRAVDILIRMLSDKSPAVRAASVDSLGRFKDPRAIESLTVKLRDENEAEEVRCAAAKALAVSGGVSAADTLSSALEHEKEPFAFDEKSAFNPLPSAACSEVHRRGYSAWTIRLRDDHRVSHWRLRLAISEALQKLKEGKKWKVVDWRERRLEIWSRLPWQDLREIWRSVENRDLEPPEEAYIENYLGFEYSDNYKPYGSEAGHRYGKEFRCPFCACAYLRCGRERYSAEEEEADGWVKSWHWYNCTYCCKSSRHLVNEYSTYD